MSFGFDENTPTIAGGGKKINTMGINIVKISKIEVTETPNGCYFEIEVVNSQGQTANQRYYEPTLLGQYAVKEEDLAWKTNAMVSFIKSIATLYLPANYTVPAQPTFAAFLNKVITDIGTKINTVDIKTIIVYNGNDFPSLRKFGIVFEAINNADPSKALVLNDKDKIVRSQGMSAEEVIATIKEEKNDLPF